MMSVFEFWSAYDCSLSTAAEEVNRDTDPNIDEIKSDERNV